MRGVRTIVVGLAVAVCALGALASPAFAKKEKLIFGEFVASIVGKHISPTEPAKVVEDKEDEAEVTGLKIGPYSFAKITVEKETTKIEPAEPCEKAPKVSGQIEGEQTKSLLTEVDFRNCTSYIKGPGFIPYKQVSFKLGIRWIANESAEIGKDEGGIAISKSALIRFKGAAQECEVEIPAQFVPAASEEKEEKFWEAEEYTPEPEEPVENWERSKKLKEQYPGDVKNRLEIETTEKFKHIVSYLNTSGSSSKKGCVPTSGEENGKYITEKEIEGKPNPHYHWEEFTNGSILLNVEGLEIKGGQLTFKPPA
jgi:hypothetical protein